MQPGARQRVETVPCGSFWCKLKALLFALNCRRKRADRQHCTYHNSQALGVHCCFRVVCIAATVAGRARGCAQIRTRPHVLHRSGNAGKVFSAYQKRINYISQAVKSVGVGCVQNALALRLHTITYRQTSRSKWELCKLACAPASCSSTQTH